MVLAGVAEARDLAARRVAELEGATEETKDEHERHRSRAETRLETLRTAFEQEQEENGAQVCAAILE